MTATLITNPLDLMFAALTEHRACANCGQSVASLNGRGWTHTDTGRFRCPDMSGWAEPSADEEEIEHRIDEACAEYEEIGRESGYEDGYSQARHDISEKIEAELDKATPGSRLSIDEIKAMVWAAVDL